MKKSIKKVYFFILTIILILSVNVVSLVAFADNKDEKALAAIEGKFVLTGEISDKYGYNENIVLPTAQYVSSTTNDAAILVTSPNGELISDNSFTTTQIGRYNVRYSYDSFYKDFSFMTYRKTMTVSNNGKTEFSEFPYKSNLTDKEYLDNNYNFGEGVLATVPEGSELVCVKDVNISDSRIIKEAGGLVYPKFPYASDDNNTPLLSLVYVPSVGLNNGNGNQADFRKMELTFFDAENENINFTITAFMYETETGYCNYKVSKVNNAPTTFVEKWVNSQFAGYNGRDYLDCQLNLRVYFDYLTKDVYLFNGYGAGGTAVKVGNASGFNAETVNFKISFDSYIHNNTPAQVFINGVKDIPIIDFLYYEDNVKPSLTVDFGEYVENDLPSYSVNKPFTVFTAKAYDEYTMSDKYTVKAFYDFTNTKEEIAIVDGKFVPTKSGEYTLVYVAEDAFGNKNEKNVVVIFKKVIDEYNADTISITYESGDSLIYGDTLKNLSISGGEAYFEGGKVEGKFSVVAENYFPSCPTSGNTIEILVKFTPTSDEFYSESNIFVKAQIKKVAPSLKELICEKTELKLGDTLPKLNGVFYDVDGNILAGKTVWIDSDLKIGVNDYVYKFIPNDTQNYEIVTGVVSLTVVKNDSNTGCKGELDVNSFGLVALMFVCFILIAKKRRA